MSKSRKSYPIVFLSCAISSATSSEVEKFKPAEINIKDSLRASSSIGPIS